VRTAATSPATSTIVRRPGVGRHQGSPRWPSSPAQWSPVPAPTAATRRPIASSFQITSVARIHSVTVILTVVTALLVAYCAHVRHRDWAAVRQPLTLFIWLAIAQGVVGYTQYFNDVPVGLVAIHVIGAVSVWVAALQLGLATRLARATSVDDGGGRRRDVALLGVDHLHQDPVEAHRVLQVRQVLEP